MSLSLFAGPIGGVLGSITGGLLSLKGVFIDTQVSYALQVGDTIIQEMSADFVTGYHADSGLGNVTMTQTIINSDGIIQTRSQRKIEHW
jgi:hypothetical protein